MEEIYNYKIVWIGTAEVNHRRLGMVSNESIRCPASLVQSPNRQKDRVMLKWQNKWIPASAALFSREYEDTSGELVEEVNPLIAKRINTAL